MESKEQSFSSFNEMAKHILTQTLESAFSHLLLLVSIILVLPFVTTDCERLFSKLHLGDIKRADRNKLGEILKELFLIYDATHRQNEIIGVQKLAEIGL